MRRKSAPTGQDAVGGAVLHAGRGLMARAPRDSHRAKAVPRLRTRASTPDGSTRHIAVTGVPMFDEAGRFKGYGGVGATSPLASAPRRSAGRTSGSWKRMDRINRAMQGTNDLEQMMSDVLDAMLEIFASDRAWLALSVRPRRALLAGRSWSARGRVSGRGRSRRAICG